MTITVSIGNTRVFMGIANKDLIKYPSKVFNKTAYAVLSVILHISLQI